MHIRSLSLSAVALLLAIFVWGSAAQALTVYPNYVGTNVTFTSIQESSTFGDPEPLFGAPIGFADQLLFFPASFSASAAGAGGFDQTGAQLQAMVTSNNPGTYAIEKVNLSEFGDANLSGVGTNATGTFAGLSGFVTVLEVGGVAVAPTVIPFIGIFAPGDTLDLITNPGVTIWSGSATIDVASVVANATKVQLSIDNNLFAFSEAGTGALIQKKVVDGPAIIVDIVPEPGTFALLGAGLLGLATRARSRRR